MQERHRMSVTARTDRSTVIQLSCLSGEEDGGEGPSTTENEVIGDILL